MTTLNDRTQPIRGGVDINIAAADHDLSTGTPGQKGVRAIYIGVGGDLKVTTVDGSVLVFTGLLDGSIVPVHARLVWKVGTGAASMIALW